MTFLNSAFERVVRIELLGGARLLGPEGPVRVERRTAGLLVYLSMELGEPPGPMRGEEDRLRLYQAKLELHRMAIQRGYDLLGFDDLQYVDDASTRAGHYIVGQLMGDVPLRTFYCYRKGELPAETEDLIQLGVAAGQ